MSFHIDPTVASTVVSLVNNGISSLKNARELAKDSSDSKLKDELNNIYDTFLDLKDRVLRLKDENAELLKQLSEKGSIKRDAKFGYFFRDGESAPLCPKCFQKDDRPVYLDNREEDLYGRVSRLCRVCNQTYYEEQGRARSSGPSNWQS